MATLIGLCIRVKLGRALPRRFKVDIFVLPGSHSSEAAGARGRCLLGAQPQALSSSLRLPSAQ